MRVAGQREGDPVTYDEWRTRSATLDDLRFQPIPDFTDADAPDDPHSVNGSAAPTPLDKQVEAERTRRQARRIVDAEERPPAELPGFVTLADRLANPPPPVTWRIDGWQPANSRALLAAQYKSGKTTLVNNLVRSLVDGDKWLGEYTVEPVDGTVAVLDFEMPEQLLLGWLRDQGIVGDASVWPLTLRGNGGAFDLFNDDIRSQWVERFTANGVRYLVWDCVRPVADALGLDENREMGPLLVKFDQLLAEAGIPDACVIHHMGHANERSRGDSRLRDWPDVEWRLVREDPDNPASPRYIAAYGRDVAIGESRLSFDPDTRRLSIAGGSRRSTKAERAAKDITEWLSGQTEPQPKGKLEAAIDGHTRKAVRDGLAWAITAGNVVVESGPHNARLHRVAEHLQRPPEDASSTEEPML